MIYRVKYKKTFINGHLKGITVDGGFTCPDSNHMYVDHQTLRSDELSKKIKKDCVTGDKFFISGVTTEIQPKKIPSVENQGDPIE